MIVLKILFIYSLFAVLVYFLLAILINVNRSINAEDDAAFQDDAARMVALLFASIAWPITIILIIYNNIKGDLKDGKNN